jgi:murein DD-endopeptidase MepM/ murein hydrolase activator NlpD
MQLQYDILNKKLDQMQSVMGDLQNRDDNVYRVIFEAEPIPAEVRQAGVGGVDRYKDLINYDNGVLMASTSAKLDKIRREMYIQSQSYDQLAGMIKNKEAVLSISNKDLTHIASGFGTRIDPIYKIPKMHEGLDFAAPMGSPVYATGNGVISDVEYGYSGYGNNILINHMVGYQTHYCHLSKIVVKEGQQVKRGDLIGYVGSTGKSTGPHLHYEVIKDGVKIDPAYFFFNDLSPLQYETMLKMASQSNQSFD